MNAKPPIISAIVHLTLTALSVFNILAVRTKVKRRAVETSVYPHLQEEQTKI